MNSMARLILLAPAYHKDGLAAHPSGGQVQELTARRSSDARVNST